MKPPRKLPSGEHLAALILDMDGVLWRDTQPIGDLPDIFERIREHGWKFALATNNGTRSPAQFVEKLRGFGVSGVETWQVVNSAQAAAEYLKKKHPRGGPVYVLGEEGVLQALAECGFFPGCENPLAVVAGLDRSLTYERLRVAAGLIRSGVPFIGTNPDRTLPTPEGLIPGAGAILAALEAASGVQPTIVGKPHPEMYRVALERLGARPAETLVVGDRIETDIAGGQATGCPTALVLSGVTSEAAARRSPHQPTLIAADLAALLDILEAEEPPGRAALSSGKLE